MMVHLPPLAARVKPEAGRCRLSTVDSPSDTLLAVAFQTPFEIAQSQLLHLRLSSVDTREAPGALFPFFDEQGVVRFLMIDTATSPGPGARGTVFAVEDFPLEIRHHKAIYPRSITRYRPLAEMETPALAGLYHFDASRTLAGQTSLPEGLGSMLDAGNLARRVRGRESFRDQFFTLDLRRLTGGLCRSGFLARRRMELASIQRFLHETTPTRA
jgi:hypothetical protein